MGFSLQMLLLVASLAYLFIIFWLLKTKKLSVKYSLIWLASAFVLIIFSAVPYVAYVVRDLLGIQMPSNMVFTLMIGFMLLILLSLSAAVTSFAERIKRLTQTVALLEKRVRELESHSPSNRPEGKG